MLADSLVVLALLIGAPTMPEQAHGVRQGQVPDESGGALPGAAVLLASISTVAPDIRVPAQADAPRRVLAIHWGAENLPGTARVEAGIRQVLRERHGSTVDYFSEYLESDRFPPEEASDALADYIARKYRDLPIDVVFAQADPALEFVLRYRPRLFPDAPIVFLGVEEPDEARRQAGAGVAAVVSRSGYGATLDLALALHPRTRRVYVIAEAPNASLRSIVQDALARFEDRVPMTYLTETEIPALLDAVRNVTDDSLVLYIRHSQETPGRVLFPTDVAALVAEAARVPVYGVVEDYIGTGVVGGVMYHAETLGVRVGEIAAQILDGTPAQEIPVGQAERDVIFDWRQVRRWGVRASSLPDAAIMRFRTPTIWEHYRWYVVGALVVLAFQGVTIAALVVNRARRRDSEARNQAMLRAMPDMMFLLNRDWVFVDGHAADPKQLVMRPEEFIGRNHRTVIPPDLAALMEQRFAERPSPTEPAVVEYPLQLPDGEGRFEARLVPCNHDQILVVVRDITERARSAAALAESRDSYARATAAGGVGVWDWNLETNEMHIDPVLKGILGYEDHEIRNHIDDWSRHVYAADVPLVEERVRQHLSGETPLYEVEHRMRHRDGSLRWFLARGSALRQDDRPVRLIGTDTDISERKAAEHALHEAQAELTRVSRLTALGEFASSIAHEVRQPLTTIVASARAALRRLLDQTPDLTEVRTDLWEVVNAGRRADEVIQRNRDLFRHNTIRKTSLDINDVVADASILTRSRLQRSQTELVTSLPPNLPAVQADRIELQQVLLNLIGNSIDAMVNVPPDQRRIEIRTGLTEAGIVQVSVRDCGVGLDGVDMQRIFSPAYTTKPDGTGVGLSICRSIVDAHGGRLWAEPNGDRGATFTFTLPTRAVAVSS